MSTPRAGLRVGDEFYPLPTSFRLGDMILVQEATGLDFNEWARRAEKGDKSIAVVAGMLAVAIWQQKKHLQRHEVLRLVEEIDLTAISSTGPAVPASPPGEAGGPESSVGSPATSTPSAEHPPAA